MRTKRVAAGFFLKNGERIIAEQIGFVFTFAKKLHKHLRTGFIWIREDGKQKVCRNMRDLANAIMDFDGRLLNKFFEQAAKVRKVSQPA
jgi:hypothetical protein